jgi:hypothetical protein
MYHHRYIRRRFLPVNPSAQRAQRLIYMVVQNVFSFEARLHILS